MAHATFPLEWIVTVSWIVLTFSKCLIASRSRSAPGAWASIRLDAVDLQEPVHRHGLGLAGGAVPYPNLRVQTRMPFLRSTREETMPHGLRGADTLVAGSESIRIC